MSSKKDLLKASFEQFQPKTGPVFLGGTWNDSKWRDQLIPSLKVAYYNPVVPNGQWSLETQQMEEKAKEDAILNLFVITPKQSGLYAIAELTASAIRSPERTVVTFLDKDEDAEWSETQRASNQAIQNLIKETGTKVFNTLEDTADYINNR